jgi:glycosyltransferase involved in cell wall biosynthesis
MRITQLHTAYRMRGGEDAVIDAEARILRQGGHEVDRNLFRNPENNLDALPSLVSAPWNLKAAARTRNILQPPPDVVHIHNTWFAAGPAVIRAAHRVAPVVVTLHNYRIACANALLFRDGRPCLDCVGHTGLAGVRHHCYRDSAALSGLVSVTSAIQRWTGVWDQVDQVIAHNSFAAGIFQRSGVPEDRLQVVDNFTEEPGPRTTRPSQSDTVLAVSRLTPEKGLDRLIKAWKNTPTDLRLMIIGEGPERARLAEQADSRVTFSGRLPPAAVAEQMRSSRALMFPSRWFESQPLVLLEALAAGLPPLATDHPPLRAALEQLGDEVLVADHDEAWVGAIGLVEQDEVVDRLSVASRTTWEKRFTPETARSNLEHVYRAAIEHHRQVHDL